MTPPDTILRLVERFDSSRNQFTGPAYNETQIRREFIDPFFGALGWDIDNKQGAAESYKDVIHEDAIRIGSATKAPDYAFRIGGTRKFFVEAKKPAVNIKEDVSPAFQLRRYAWSAKLPVSILTDFDELAVYDCRVKPHKADKPSTARIKYLTYKDYVPHWEEIHSVFSRDAVWKGSFDKYVVGTKGKKGSDEVDDAFLKEIESWRDVLARNIALRNPRLSVHELNFAVQRTIDRIIFLRICEDRGIDTYGTLQAVANGERIYKRLCELFQRADEKYNSGLFHFSPEKGRPENPDELTLNLKLDDKVLRNILEGLYYPDCPYEFSVLPADILGQVYEQFLGKVIRLTAGHQAKVEEKPEVKKAGGVYYTPTYIVDYIVKNTVGKLVEGKTPKHVASLRVLDPACGSGSFLIGAYQYLLDWHLEWYSKDSSEKWSMGKNATLYTGSGGVWRLTTAERKRILLNNICGVDIDSQAVEVTKLSLLLKVLEGENEETINQQLKMFHERALPDLGNNIKCGNSLIGPDFFEGQLIVDQDERNRINAFDWNAEFTEIMQRGGFDAVIGNPPYIRIQGFPQDEIAYLSSHYRSATGNFDIYVCFVERGVSLLTSNGVHGFILPNKFFRTDYGIGLRSLLSSASAIDRIVDFEAGQVFDASTYTCLLFLSRKIISNVEYAKAEPSATSLANVRWAKTSSALLGSETWTLEDQDTLDLRKTIWQSSDKLLELPVMISRGSSSGADKIFMVDRSTKLESEILRTPLFATDFSRYHFDPLSEYLIIYPYQIADGEAKLIEENELKLRFPRTYKYLRDNRTALIKRKQFQAWYGYSAPRNLELHDRADICIPLLANKGLFSTIPDSYHGKLCFMASGGFTITIGRNVFEDKRYVLGVINSKLLFWELRQRSNLFRGGWITCTKQYFGGLPIRRIMPSNTEDKSCHDRMVQLVESTLQLHKDLTKAKADHERTTLQRQIDATDKQIDELVYELYGLTEEEIRIVEGSGGKAR